MTSRQRHIIKFDDTGWIIQHPMSCRPNLFACEVNGMCRESLTPDDYQPGLFWLDVVRLDGVVYKVHVGDPLTAEDELMIERESLVEQTNWKFARVMAYFEDQGVGQFAIMRHPSKLDRTEWVVAFEFGRESPDSPMAGGAAYASSATIGGALDDIIIQCGLDARGY